MKRLLALFLLVCGFAYAEPIQPLPQGTVTISCTGSSAATALARPDQYNRRQVEISNGGTVTIFVEFGNSNAATAVLASGYPVLAGQTKVVSVPNTTTHIACIATSGTQTVYATAGIGD